MPIRVVCSDCKTTYRVSESAAAAGPARARSRAKASGAAATAGPQADGDLSALSKAALVARAAALGVPGRSRMSRQELEAAVAGAAKAPKRRKAS